MARSSGLVPLFAEAVAAVEAEVVEAPVAQSSGLVPLFAEPVAVVAVVEAVAAVGAEKVQGVLR